MKTNLFKATVRKTASTTDHNRGKEREVYIAAEKMIDAANKLVEELNISEELREITQVSDECYT